MSEANLCHFTDEQWEIIEVMITRQLAAYNQRLFEKGAVSFELQLTEAQQRLLDDESARRPDK